MNPTKTCPFRQGGTVEHTGAIRPPECREDCALYRGNGKCGLASSKNTAFESTDLVYLAIIAMVTIMFVACVGGR